MKAVIQANVFNQNGAVSVAPNASIAIRDPDSGALIQLYEDRDGNGNPGNPFLADSRGFFRVYADPGTYHVYVTTGAGTQTYLDVPFQSDEKIASIAVLRTVTPINGHRIYLKAHTTEGDGGHGFFRGVTGAAPGTYTDNGGTIIVPTGGDGSAAWLRDSDRVSVADFGAVGDSATNNDTSFANADSATGGHGRVYVPAGTYVLTSAPSNYHKFYGPGLLDVAGQLRALYCRVGLNDPTTENEVCGGVMFGGNGPGHSGVVGKGSGNGSWMEFKAARAGAATQVQVYPHAFQGTGYPSAANQITRSSGDDLNSSDIEVGDNFYWNGTLYHVATIVSADVIELETTGGASPGFTIDSSNIQPYYHVYHYSEGTADVTVGGTVSWVSGDYFVSGSTFDLTLDGAKETVSSYTSKTELALSGYASGAKSGVAFKLRATPQLPYLSIFRIQGLFGGSEEDLAFINTPTGRALIENQYAGDGNYRPMIFRCGPKAAADDYFAEQGDYSSSRVSMTIGATGYVQFGGAFNDPPTDCLVTTRRDIPTTETNTAGGTTRRDSLKVYANYRGDSVLRQVVIGHYNDFQGGFIQAEDNGGIGQNLQIQPTSGSKLLIGKKSAAAVPEKLTVDGNVAPYADNTYSMGTASYRWSVIYSATGAINTSDERLKQDVAPSDLGLEFIEALHPVKYRWTVGGQDIEVIDEPEEYEEQATESRSVEREIVNIIDGRAVVTMDTETVQVPLFDRFPVVDAAGRPVLDDNGLQRTHLVPRMVKKMRTRQVERLTEKQGSRVHYGLLAQQVKAALDAAGVGDFAGWTLADKDDPNSQQGLRYDQFIAPLIRAVQELSARVKSLESMWTP